MVDEKKIRQAVRLMLEGIGEDPKREGLIDTPERVARMCTEIYSGMDEDASVHLSKRFGVEGCDFILEKDITFYSMCEHHMMPFFGKAHIAYCPTDRVAGLSKLARTVEVFAKRLQLQERMTAQIADAIFQSLGARGVMVVTEAEHTCMTMRGVKKSGSKTVTTVVRGAFDTAAQERVLRLIQGGSER